ncbi:unnamed protein product, partial [marine sediment metagenome]
KNITMKKAVLVTNMIAPYRIPVWNHVNQQSEFGFKIFFMKEAEFNRDWKIPIEEIKFKYEVLSGLHLPIKKLNWEIHFNLGVFLKLRKENPDIIILDGYDSPTVWIALLYAKLYRKKIVSWIGSTSLFSSKKKGIIGLLKRMFVKRSDSFIAYGGLAKEYLLSLGAPKSKISVGCNVGDIDFFKKKVEDFRKTQDFSEARKKYPEIIFLFVGRLVKEKGVVEILNALKDIKEKNWGLIIIGSGPSFSEI